MTRRIQGLGWRPSLPDARDLVADPSELKVLPEVDPRADMPPVFDQGQLGCHDEATEVLAQSGWTRWADYDGEDLLGTINPATQALEFQAPTAVHAYEYDGPLHYADHQRLDFAVTPNHRMWRRKWDQRAKTLADEYSFCETQDIGWYSGLLAAPSGHVGVGLDRLTVGPRTYTGDDFLALVALVASDGWVGGTENNWNTVSFCCFREDRYAMVAALAQRLGIMEVPSRKGVWKWSDPALAAWVRGNLFVGDVFRSPMKRLPSVVQAADTAQIEHFLRFFGDQHVDIARGSRQFYSSSSAMVDDLQTLLLKVGKRSSIYERAPRDTQMRDGRRIEADHCTRDLTLTEWSGDGLSLDRKKNMAVERYNGGVFCATVPNGLLVTRRNGSVLISGNSCTSNAVATCVEYDRILDGADPGVPSRLFIYYCERLIEGSLGQGDTGAFGRDGFKAARTYGTPLETEWPYDVAQYARKPTEAVWTDAAKGKLTKQYRAVPRTVPALKAVLGNRQTVAFGFTVHESFEGADVAKTGVVPVPIPGERVIGGHEMLIVGYLKDEPHHALAKNSWSTGWALSGYCLFPWSMLLDPHTSGDFRTVRRPLAL